MKTLISTLVAFFALVSVSFAADLIVPKAPIACGQEASAAVTINFKRCPSGYSAKMPAAYMAQGADVLIDMRNGFVFAESKTIKSSKRRSCWVVKHAAETSANVFTVTPTKGVMRTNGKFRSKGKSKIVAVEAVSGGCNGVTKSATSGAKIVVYTMAEARALVR